MVVGVEALVLCALIVLAGFVRYVVPRLRQLRRSVLWSGGSRERMRRARDVELGAGEAALDDPEFAPDVLVSAAGRLFADIQHARSAGSPDRLERLATKDVAAQWLQRLVDDRRLGWRREIKIVAGPAVTLVGLRNPAGDRDDRAVVLIEAKLDELVFDEYGQRFDREESGAGRRRLREYWILSKRGRDWVLQSIEQSGEGQHELSDAIITAAWKDEAALRDEALVEGAVAEAVPAVAEIASSDGDGDGDTHAAVMDLALADGRFAPDVFAVAVRRGIAAWEEAIDGDDTDLRAIAQKSAIRQLHYPVGSSARIRVVVRGLQVRGITVVSLNAKARPPTVIVDIELAGIRYLEDRDTRACVSGSSERTTEFTQRWKLMLDGPAKQPWRIAAAGTPSRGRK